MFDEDFAHHVANFFAEICEDHHANLPDYGTIGYDMSAKGISDLLDEVLAYVGPRDPHKACDSYPWNVIHEIGAIAMHTLAWSMGVPERALVQQVKERILRGKAEERMTRGLFALPLNTAPFMGILTANLLFIGEIGVARDNLGVKRVPPGNVAIEVRVWALIDAITALIGELTMQITVLQSCSNDILKRGGAIMASGYDKCLVAFHVESEHELNGATHIRLVPGLAGPVVGIIDEDHVAVELPIGKLLSYVRARIAKNGVPIGLDGVCGIAKPIATRDAASPAACKRHLEAMAADLFAHSDDEPEPPGTEDELGG